MLNIPDTAWKFGCGRYLQSADALTHLMEEIERLGGRPFVVAGHRAWDAVKAVYPELAALEAGAFELYSGPCTIERTEAFAKAAAGCSVIVGVGGGRVMDLAKLAGQMAKLPVINVPTVSSTCAAFTPLSVMYTEEGRTVGTWYHPTEVDAVIADTTVLSRQPVRYAAAGVMDSLAKACEIAHHGARAQEKNDLRAAFFMANYLFERLSAICEKVVADIGACTNSDVVDELAFLTLALTGMISGTARGCLQTAVGHAFYEEVRKQFPRESADALHGELVGLGLRYQTEYSGVLKAEVEKMGKVLQIAQSVGAVGLDPQTLPVLAQGMTARMGQDGKIVDAEKLLTIMQQRG